MALPLADLGPNGWRFVYVLALVWLVAALDVSRRLTETPRFEHIVEAHTVGKVRLDGRRFAIIGSVAFLANFFIAPASFFQNRYLDDIRGYSGAGIAAFTIATATPASIGFVVGGRLADTAGRRRVLSISIPLATLGLVGSFSVGGWAMWACAFVGDSLLGPRGTLPAALRLDDLICRQMVLMLCPELSAEETEAGTPPSSAGFELLLEWASSRVAEPLSLSQLEARSGYSRRALQRAFQQRFGCGPMQWLRRRRLELALERLGRADATDSVSAIARRCGYMNVANFSRDFSRVYGRRPSEILRANQQPPAP